MNRELKFRAWDKTRKIMIGRGYPNNWDNNKDEWWADVAAMQLTGIEDISKEEEYEVMQYTGLKDKNGVPIYEGDVIKKDHCDMESYGELKTDGMRWWIEDTLNDTHHENMDTTSGKFCEVIGNIYEHGDLLK